MPAGKWCLDGSNAAEPSLSPSSVLASWRESSKSETSDCHCDVCRCVLEPAEMPDNAEDAKAQVQVGVLRLIISSVQGCTEFRRIRSTTAVPQGRLGKHSSLSSFVTCHALCRLLPLRILPLQWKHWMRNHWLCCGDSFNRPRLGCRRRVPCSSSTSSSLAPRVGQPVRRGRGRPRPLEW